MVQVVRDGAQKEIEASELVVGDIVLIRVGDKTPADIRMLECHSIKVIASGVKEPCLLLHQRSGGSRHWGGDQQGGGIINVRVFRPSA